MRSGFVGLLALAACFAASAQAADKITVEQLLADGWEVAGFSSTYAMVGSIILFKHKDKNYFVQCSAVYDATRGATSAARVVSNCYEIR